MLVYEGGDIINVTVNNNPTVFRAVMFHNLTPVVVT